MTFEKTRVVADDQNINDTARAGVQTFASAAPAMGSTLDNAGDIQAPIAPGGVTDDRQPEFQGQGTPGDIIVIRDNGTVIGLADVEANGTWTFTPSTDLLPGLHAITVVARDASGEESESSAPFHFEIDVTPPNASQLFVTGVMDTAGGVTGNVTSGGTTDDARPLLSGISTGTPGHTVTVMVKDTTGTHVLGEALIGEGGHWTFQVGTPLLSGLNTLMLVERDAAGNQTMPTGRYKITVNTDKPTAPVIENLFDDVGTPHMLQKGEVTDDAKPTIIGTAQAGNTIKLYDGGTYLGEVVANDEGNWRFTPQANLADGAHSITATSTSPLGQTSDATGIWNFSVDTKPPETVTGLEVLDNVGDKQDPLVSGDTTDDNKPEFKGKAEPGATVNLYEGDTLLGSVVVDETGNWSITPTTPLVDGPHSLTTEVVDPAGNSSGKGPALDITVDTTDVTVSIDTLKDDQGSVQGAIAAGGTTDDTRPEIVGTGKAGSTVKVYDNNGATLLGETVVKPDGTWNFTPTADLTEGAHTLTATATDLSGNVSKATPVVGFTIDTTAPTAPTIETALDDVGAKQDPLSSGAVTDDPSPTLKGKAEAGSTVTIKDGQSVLGTAVADANGDWKYTPTTPLSEGEHKFTVAATDKAGNTSVPSGEFVLTTDYTPPAASAATLSDDVGAIRDPIVNGTVTDDDTPTYAGKTEPNATVVIYDDGKEIGRVQASATGDWSFTPTVPLAPGAHSFSNAVIDVAGNVGAEGAPIDFTVDVAPATIGIDGATDNAGTILGEIAKGGVTDDDTPTLHGKATPGGTVKVYNGNVLLGSTVADPDGDWKFTPSSALGEGQYTLSATVTTPANGESAKTAVFDLTVDLTAPTAPTLVTVADDVGSIKTDVTTGGVTDDANPEFRGKAEANSTVVIKDNDVEIGRVQTDANGDWKFTPGTALGDGPHSITLTATDKAGNTSAPSDAFGFTVDTAPPAQPTIVKVADDVGSITADVTQGGITDDPRPDFTGKAEANSTVVVYDKGAELARVTADADGNWTYTPATPLSNSTHSFTVAAIDKAGNISAPSDVFSFTVNTVPPAKPIIVTVMDNVGSVQDELYSGEFTDDAQPVFTGKAEANSTVIVLDNGIEVYRTQASASGSWTYTPATALSEGGHSFSAITVNKAGVSSVPSSAFGFTVDTVPPAAPTIVTVYDDVGVTGNVTNGGTTDDTKPDFKGKAEADSTVKIYDGGKLLGTVVASALGDWSYTPTTALANGAHNITVTAMDKAGNTGTASNGFNFTVLPLASGSENFESEVLGSIGLGKPYVSKSGLIVTTLKGDATIHWDENNIYGKTILVGYSGNGSTVEFDIPDATNKVSLSIAGTNSFGNTVEFFNAQGVVIHTWTVPNTASLVPMKYQFTAPGGQTIDGFKVLVVGDGAGIYVDDIYWGSAVSATSISMDALPDEINPEGNSFHAFTGSDDQIIAKLGFADRLEGGAGNDTFTNVGTADVVHGGLGDDVIRIHSGDFERVDGGLGIDTLVMDGKAMHIDLSALGMKVQGFEKFDLGAGGNTLALSAHDVLAGGLRDLVTADGKVQMLVDGANGDVDLLGGSAGDNGWTSGGTTSVSGVTYSVYTNLAGTAELLVEDKVHVTIL